MTGTLNAGPNDGPDAGPNAAPNDDPAVDRAPADAPDDDPEVDRDRMLAALDRTEAQLDPARPVDAGRVQVIGYGEISVALEVADLPGLVCKRMSGYRDPASVSAFMDLMHGYLAELEAAEVRVVPTEAIPVSRPGRPPVVYLVQPKLDPQTLGTSLLRTAADDALAVAIRQALDAVARLARRTADRTDGVEVALDGQLSNWSFGPPDSAPPDSAPSGPAPGGPALGGPAPAGRSPDEAAGPVLIDVGTPFVRHRGSHVMDREVLLAPVPPGLRAYYRKRGLIEAYLDDYFVPRTVALDLLGNFHKEGATERLDVGHEVVNDWLATADVPGPNDPIEATEVTQYYRKDADLLALYLRLRRMDRFMRTKALRRDYDYVLPGSVAR